MQAADLVGKILAERGLTQTALAELLGIDPSMPSNWVSGRREPGPVQCLLLASLSVRVDERQWWIGKSGLDNKRLQIIADLLSVPIQTLSHDEAELLEFWRSPQGQIESSLKDLITHTLGERRGKK